MRYIGEKLTIFLTPIVLILIGLAGRRFSLKAQRLIFFPLIISSTFFLIWFVITHFWMWIINWKVIISGYNIGPLLATLSTIFGQLIGLICVISIANKSLKIEVKLTFSNIINLYAGVWIGMCIGYGIALISIFIIPEDLLHNFWVKLTDELFLGYIFAPLIVCLVGACGVVIIIILNKKLREEIKQ